MIKDKVENGKAILECLECGAKQPIIQYTGELIDMEKTVDKIDLFYTTHRLCKKQIIQTELTWPG